MAIQRSNIAAQSIRQNYDIAIRMLSAPPTSEYLDVVQAPNIMYGFYNAALDQVQLYIVDSTGRRYVKVK